MTEMYDVRTMKKLKKRVRREQKVRRLLNSKHIYFVPHVDDVESKKWWILNSLFPSSYDRRESFGVWVSPDDAYRQLSFESSKGASFKEIEDHFTREVPWRSLEMKAIIKTGSTWEDHLREETVKKSVVEWGIGVASI